MTSGSERSVVLYELMSLDGYADDPGEGEWFGDADGGLLDFLDDTISGQDTILLGRLTFEKWAPHWPTSTMQPFADFINSTPKTVFSSRPLIFDWDGTTRVSGPAADHVTELKRRAGGQIGVHGSLSLARALLAAQLVDELRLVVAPSLAGHGKRLFGEGELQRFELLDCTRSGGCLLLHYRRRAAG